MANAISLSLEASPTFYPSDFGNYAETRASPSRNIPSSEPESRKALTGTQKSMTEQ
jgi:hypothetical protein